MKKLFTLLYFVGVFSANGDSWTQKASFPGIARELPFSFSIGNKGYVGTGAVNAFSTVSNEFWEYNPSTNVWTQKANFAGVARLGASGFTIGNKGYAGLGLDGSFITLDDFWEYDPSTNIWTQKANFGGVSRAGGVGFSTGTKGYVGLGFDGTFNDLQDFWEYTPLTNTWLQKTNFGSARVSSSCFTIGNYGYVVAGTSLNGSVYLADLWEYNSLSNTWSQKANFPSNAREDAAAFSICAKGYFGTGEFTVGYGSDLWQYNPVTNSWIQKTNFPGLSRDEPAYFSIGIKGYIGLGGKDGSPDYNDFWEYTPDSACTTGIEEFPISNFDFQISPNPAKEFVVISSEYGENKKIDLTITDVNGKQVYQQVQILNFNFQTKINISSFPQGIYFIALTNEQGNKMMRKVVKM